MKYTATVSALVTVEFEDDGETDLSTQAAEEFDSHLSLSYGDAEILNITDIKPKETDQ